MSIAENTALFSLLGTTYGGDGQTTFALPDLRGRVAVGTGQGPGLSSWDEGQVEGTEQVTLLTTQMPAHIHSIQESIKVSSAPATQSVPDASVNTIAAFVDASGGGAPFSAFNSQMPDITLNTASSAAPTGVQGGSQPFPTMAPYLALNYIIAVEGIYPSRN